MKRLLPFVLYLAALSLLSGYMLSKASLLGKAGISLFYKEYSFLKVWWQAGLLVFTVLMVLYFIQAIIHDRTSKSIARGTQITAIFIAITGLVLTYNDFRDNLAHRWMGERFHIGAYCFWIGWLSISIYLLFQKKKQNITTSDSKDPITP